MKVAIAGYGQEGEASLLYWQARGAEVAVYDEKQPERIIPERVKSYIGEDAYSKMSEYDLVVRTAGLSPHKITSGKKVWSATNEFFAQCPIPIIGVTGTKGKGTTATLISKILEQSGHKTWLIGNIGVPALSVLEEIKGYKPNSLDLKSDSSAVVVFELSSFQLWDLKRSPETAVVLMIEPDHMDIHASMEEYVNAKANITTYQTKNDVVIYHPTNKFSNQIAQRSPGTKLQYMVSETAHVAKSQSKSISGPAQSDYMHEWVTVENHPICKTTDVGLIGKHNLENICAAITTAWNFTHDLSAIKAAITAFKGLPHRLEFVDEVNGIRYYDDSQATGVASCLAAIRSFSEPTTLILGGSEKAVDISDVINELDSTRHKVIVVGQVSNKLEALLKKRSFKNYINLGTDTTMSKIVTHATELTEPGGVVLLSPAHASFGMFINYQDRGDQFKAAVKAL